jgi:hypothetical protein
LKIQEKNPKNLIKHWRTWKKTKLKILENDNADSIQIRHILWKSYLILYTYESTSNTNPIHFFFLPFCFILSKASN